MYEFDDIFLHEIGHTCCMVCSIRPSVGFGGGEGGGEKKKAICAIAHIHTYMYTLVANTGEKETTLDEMRCWPYTHTHTHTYIHKATYR